MQFTYKPKGVCSRKIHLEVEDGVVTGLRFEGGCDGNLQGVAKLAVGHRPEELVELLSGIRCGYKDTSCPDQLARAAAQLLEQTELSKKAV